MQVYNIDGKIIECYSISHIKIQNTNAHAHICSALESIKTKAKQNKNSLLNLRNSYKKQEDDSTEQSDNQLIKKLEITVNQAVAVYQEIEDNEYNISLLKTQYSQFLSATKELLSISQNKSLIESSFTNDHKYSYLFGVIAGAALFATYYFIDDKSMFCLTSIGSLLLAPIIYYKDIEINNHLKIIENTQDYSLAKFIGDVEHNLNYLDS